MGFFGGIGKAIKKVGGGAGRFAHLPGMGGDDAPPASTASSAAMDTMAQPGDPGWGGMAGAGNAVGTMANPNITSENIRTMKQGGMGEADAVRAAVMPGRNRIIPRGDMAGLAGGMGGAMYPGGSKTFDESDPNGEVGSAVGQFQMPSIPGTKSGPGWMSQRDAASNPAVVPPDGAAVGGPLQQLLLKRQMQADMGGGAMGMAKRFGRR